MTYFPFRSGFAAASFVLVAAAACGGRSVLTTDEFGQPGGSFAGTGGASVGVGTGGASVGKGGAVGLGGSTVGTGGISVGVGGSTVGTGGAIVGVGGAPVGQGGSVGKGGATTVGMGGAGVGGSTSACVSCIDGVGPGVCGANYKQCQATPQCAALDNCAAKSGCYDSPSFDACAQKACGSLATPLALNTLHSYVQCATCTSPCGSSSCGNLYNQLCNGPGPGGTGGAPSCSPGQVCPPGSGCAVPLGNGCTETCNCDPSGHFQCGTSCGPGGVGGAPGGCFPGQGCQPGTGCVGPVPGQPNCEYQCNCDFTGQYNCGETCSGPVGVGGGPGCDQCVANTVGSGACPAESSQCQATPGCGALAKCGIASGCFSNGGNLAQCLQAVGCPFNPVAYMALIPLANCAECQGCQGICPTAPGQCGSGPVGVGGGPQGCSSCIFDTLQTGGCPTESDTCFNTPGCTQLAQCYQNNGCFDSPDAITCGQKTCPSTLEAEGALVGFLQCAECGQCAGKCNGVGVCSAGAGGSSQGAGGTGAGGTGSGLTCDQCVQQNQGQCSTEINACVSNPDCSQLLMCQQNCADQACIDGCSQKFPAGVAGYDAIIFCLGCKVCGNECSSQVPPDFCMTPPAGG